MRPFSKNKERSREASEREGKRSYDECFDVAAPGESFVYLGARFVCIRNYVVVLKSPAFGCLPAPMREPGITAEYRDENGVIRQKEFPYSMLPALKAENER